VVRSVATRNLQTPSLASTTGVATRLSLGRRTLTVHALSPRAGITVIQVRKGGATILACAVPATPGRLVTCSARLRRPVARTDLSVVARLRQRLHRPVVSRPLVDVREGYLTVRVVAGRAGTVAMSSSLGGRRLASCRAERVPAGRTVTCSKKIDRSVPVSRIRVTVSLSNGVSTVVGRY
jgi:hypothetical protein